jgi:hypothetical protein
VQTAGSPYPFAGSLSGLRSPIPLFVENVPPWFNVTFDIPIVPGFLDEPNWTARFNNQRFEASAVQAGLFGPNEVAMTRQIPPTPEAGRDEVVYSPPPFDVVGVDAGPALPFVIETFV